MSSVLFSSKSRSRPIAPIAAFGLWIIASPAGAQNRLTVDTSASAGVATNPFLEPGPAPTAATTTIGLRPSWVSERPLTTLRIDGAADVSFYDHDYGTNGNVTVQGSGTHKMTEYTTLNAALGYVNTIVGSFNDVGVPIGTPMIVNAPSTISSPVAAEAPAILQPDLPAFVTDPALNGIGRRRKAYLASGGIATMLTPRDQLAFNIMASVNRSSGSERVEPADLDDFNYVTPSVSFSRTISEVFSVGASLGIGLTDYRGTRVNDALIFGPSLTATRVIGERWTLTASLGAAIVNVNDSGGGKRTSTNLNGTANLCRQESRWSTCITASRQTVPSSFQGVRTQTSGSASLGYRASDRDDLSFNGGYSHASDPIQSTVTGGTRAGSVDFANASGSYARRFTPALSGFITVGYAKAFDNDGLKRDGSLTALAGVTYRFSRQP